MEYGLGYFVSSQSDNHIFLAAFSPSSLRRKDRARCEAIPFREDLGALEFDDDGAELPRQRRRLLFGRQDSSRTRRDRESARLSL